MRVHRLLSPLVLLAVLAAGLVAGSSSATGNADMDCDDFATQAAAQTFFLNAGPGDPHRLDAEGDGRACESNPCPCMTSAAPVPLVGQTTPPSPTSPDAGSDNEGSGSSGPVRRHWGKVVKVTDGDTLSVRVAGLGLRSVRVLGIDTPEVYGAQECGGDTASAHMARLAPVGSRVQLESDPSQAGTDRYGRWLRYVARRGLDVGRQQIRRGFGRTYVYRNDPFLRTRSYQRAERVARDLQRGSWDLCW